VPTLGICKADREKQKEQNLSGLTRKTLLQQIRVSKMRVPRYRQELREAINEIHLAHRSLEQKRPRVSNSLLFYNRIDRVGGNTLQHLHFASGPADLHGIDLHGGTEAKVRARVVLRAVSLPGSYFRIDLVWF